MKQAYIGGLVIFLFVAVVLGWMMRKTQIVNVEPVSEQLLNETEPEIVPVEKTVRARFLTSEGEIVVDLFGEASPVTVGNFVKLAESGFYNGTSFHRVIPGFMIQGGDPLSKDQASRATHGTGDPGYAFADEFNDLKLVRGSLAMANSGPNTNGSQFFIVTAEATPYLDGVHTNFGQVVSGMEVVEAISLKEADGADNPVVPVVVEEVVIDG